jgi:hypothetical protein
LFLVQFTILFPYSLGLELYSWVRSVLVVMQNNVIHDGIFYDPFENIFEPVVNVIYVMLDVLLYVAQWK